MTYIINFGSPKIKEIEKCVRALGLPFKTVAWDATDANFENASRFILSGSPTYLTETAHAPYIQRYHFLKTVKVPVLGICFGHQVLGLLHGASIYRGEPVRTSVDIEVLQSLPLFEGLGKTTGMTEDHTEGITLPEGFIHLASSKTYKNEGMKHPDKDIYGVQFHPEVSGENGMRLLKNFAFLM